MGIKRNTARDLDADTLRCLLWLMLQRNGGAATFTRKELDAMPTVGEILVGDNSDQITIKTLVANEPAAPPVRRG